MNRYCEQNYYHDPLNKAANDIYSLFLIGAMIGWLTIPIGSVAAFFYYRRTDNICYRSHFKYQIAGSFWLMITFGLFAFALYFFLLSPQAAINIHHDPLTNAYRAEIYAGFVLWFVALYVLWFRRFWCGYRLLNAKKTINNPLTIWLPRADNTTSPPGK